MKTARKKTKVLKRKSNKAKEEKLELPSSEEKVSPWRIITTETTSEPLESAPENLIQEQIKEEVSKVEKNPPVEDSLINGSHEELVGDKGPSAQKVVLSFFGGLILGILITNGIFYFKTKKPVIKNEVKESSSALTPAAEISPTVTEEPEKIDFSKYKVRVLNGSGVKGAAAGVKDLLTELGFKNIGTGNATSSAFQKTSIRAKESLPEAVFGKIEEVLGDYEVIKDSSLAETENYDAIIIVGDKKKKEIPL